MTADTGGQQPSGRLEAISSRGVEVSLQTPALVGPSLDAAVHSFAAMAVSLLPSWSSLLQMGQRAHVACQARPTGHPCPA